MGWDGPPEKLCRENTRRRGLASASEPSVPIAAKNMTAAFISMSWCGKHDVVPGNNQRALRVKPA